MISHTHIYILNFFIEYLLLLVERKHHNSFFIFKVVNTGREMHNILNENNFKPTLLANEINEEGESQYTVML